MLQNTRLTTPPSLGGGLVTLTNFFADGPTQSPNCMNVRYNIGTSVEKRFGTASANSVILISSATTGFSPDSSGSLSTNLNAYWKLNEVGGTRIDSFDGVNLTDVNTVTSTGGIVSGAGFFVEANSEYLLSVNSSTIQTGDIDFSLAGWFLLTTTGERTLVSKRGGINSLNLRRCLISWWKLNEGVGDRLDSASSNTLTSNSAVQAVVGQINTAASFVRSSGHYLAVSDNASLSVSTTTDFTISAWVNLRTNTATMAIIAKGEGPADEDEEYALILNSGATLRYRFEVDDGASGSAKGTVDADTFGAPGTGTYQFVVCWWDAGASMLNIQVNNGGINSSSYTSGITDTVRPFHIGAFSNTGAATFLDARVDEVGFWKRLLTTQEKTDLYNAGKGITHPLIDSQYEYSLFVNTDNVVTFRVSSDGLVHQGQVRATSFGAVATGTYLFVSAFHNAATDSMGVAVNNTQDAVSYTGTVFAGSGPLVLGAGGSGQTAFMNGAMDEWGFWKKVLSAQERTDLRNVAGASTGNTYEKGTSSSGFGSFDFGTVGALRWYVVAAGSGIFASSNRGVAFVTIATDRSADYQSFFTSRSQLIATSDSRNAVLIWPGSVGTFMTALGPGSAPGVKYGIDFAGFTMLMNSVANPRSIFYDDNNSFPTSPWTRTFSVGGDIDDEITDPSILNKKLYVSTKRQVVRVSPVGGFPDFSTQRIISSWGFVPRTVVPVTLPQVGEVLMGFCWDRRVRIFDGTDGQVISDPIEQDNRMFPFPILKANQIFYNKTFAELDSNEQVYKLTLVMAPSSETTHTFCYNLRTGAWYPYQYTNPGFNTMVMAASADNTDVLMAVGRNGFVYRMDTGNTDNGVPVDEYYEFPFFMRTPKTVTKNYEMDLYFTPTSSGTLYFQERTNFGTGFKARDTISFASTGGLIQIAKAIDIPTTQNVYQGRLTSSANTAEPWRLNRIELYTQDMGVGKA